MWCKVHWILRVNYVFFLKKLAAIHNADLTSSGEIGKLYLEKSSYWVIFTESSRFCRVEIHDIMDFNQIGLHFIGKVYCVYWRRTTHNPPTPNNSQLFEVPAGGTGRGDRETLLHRCGLVWFHQWWGHWERWNRFGMLDLFRFASLLCIHV